MKIFAGHVVLQTTAGKQFKVLKSGLCDEDLEYLEYIIPPEIEIKVYIHRDKEILESRSDYVRKAEKINGKVTLTKTNRDLSNRKLTAYLYIFTKKINGKGLLVLDKAEHEFSFEHQNIVEFSGNPSSIRYTHYSSRSRNEGEEYEGYLLFVEDDKGDLICAKGSRLVYESKVGQIRKAKKGSRLDANFNVREERG